MNITPQIIRAAVPRHPTAEVTALKMTLALERFNITDARSVAALLANLTVESGIVPKRENLYYTTAARLKAVWPSRFDPARGGTTPTGPYLGNPQGLANLVYAGKLGNGDVASGDGWRFRGGGFIQTTGETNYQQTGLLINQPLRSTPELIEQIGVSCLAACAYWTRMSNADQRAKASDIGGTRYAVNGPRGLGMADMLAVYHRVLPLLS